MTNSQPSPDRLNPSVTTMVDTDVAAPEGEAEMPGGHDRNASYDYARLLAVIGIIWFHVGAPGALIGYAGLAFFLMLLVVLALPQILAMRDLTHRAPPVLRYAAARARRLIIPWLIASVAYGGLKLVEVSRGASFNTEFTANMWITGTAIHLWFLPFAFAVGIAIWPLGRWLRRVDETAWVWLSFAFALLGLIALIGMQETHLPVPLAQWAYALPAVLVGVAMALARGAVPLMVGVLVLFLCVALAANLTVGLVEIGLAGICVILCALIPTRPTPASAWCAKASLWVYLIHPAVSTVVVRGTAVAEGTVLLAAIVTILCLGIVFVWETVAVPRFGSKALFS